MHLIQLISLVSLFSAAVPPVVHSPQALIDDFQKVGQSFLDKAHGEVNVIDIIAGAVTVNPVKEVGKVPEGMVLVRNGKKERWVDPADLQKLHLADLDDKQAKFLGIEPFKVKRPIFQEMPGTGMKRWQKNVLAGGAVVGTGAAGTALVLNNNKHK